MRPPPLTRRDCSTPWALDWASRPRPSAFRSLPTLGPTPFVLGYWRDGQIFLRASHTWGVPLGEPTRHRILVLSEALRGRATCGRDQAHDGHHDRSPPFTHADLGARAR